MPRRRAQRPSQAPGARGGHTQNARCGFDVHARLPWLVVVACVAIVVAWVSLRAHPSQPAAHNAAPTFDDLPPLSKLAASKGAPVPTSTAVASTHDKIESLLATGAELHRQSDLAAAMQAYTSVLELDPSNPDALHLSGLVMMAWGDMQGAEARVIAALDAAFPRQPSHLHQDVADLDRVTQQVAVSPGQVANFFNSLGEVRRRGGGFVAAEAAFRAAIAVDSRGGNVNPVTNLAWVLDSQGRLEESRQLYEEVVAKAPRMTAAVVDLGKPCDRGYPRAACGLTHDTRDSAGTQEAWGP